MNYIKNQMEVVELKSINAEMKNSVEELSSTFELAKKKKSLDLKTGQLGLYSLRNRNKKNEKDYQKLRDL